MARKAAKTKKAAPKKEATKKKAAPKKAATKKKKTAKTSKTSSKKGVATKDDPKEVAAKTTKKKATKRRKKADEIVRLKAFWGVFSQTLKQVALFEYHQKKQALDKAAALSKSGKPPHFVRIVKEPIVEEA